MSIHRFIGANTREAMRKVRDTLGDNALILANQATAEGFEILASTDQALAARYSATAAETAEAADPADWQPDTAQKWQETVLETSATAVNAGHAAARSAPPMGGGRSEPLSQLLSEVRGVKAMINSRLPQLKEIDNFQRLHNQLVGAGFDLLVADEICQNLPEQWQVGEWPRAEVAEWLLRQLSYQVPEIQDGEALVDGGGIFALVGPTGSGKTTTTAKIAARYVMKHGPKNIALVSTDHYRVGAHEHLKEYADLLDVSFVGLKANQNLQQVLGKLRDKRVVLVDTVGLSQRDANVISNFEHFAPGMEQLSIILMLNAGSHDKTLEEVINCYQQAANTTGNSIDYAIFTKLDEAPSPIAVVDKAIRYGLNVVLATSGQRVPEDIEVPSIPTLLRPSVEALLAQDEAPKNGEHQRAADWTRNLMFQGRQVAVAMDMAARVVPGFEQLAALWDISLLHPDWQTSRIEHQLNLHRLDGTADNTIFWGEEKLVRGCFFQCPDLVMDKALLPTAITMLQYRQPETGPARLQAAEKAQQATAAHLFSEMPGADSLHWLAEQRRRWLAPALETQVLEHGGESLVVNDLRDHLELVDEFGLRYRDHRITAQIERSSVKLQLLPDRRKKQPVPVTLWRGVLHSAESGMEVSTRFWLSSDHNSCKALIPAQLALENLPALTRRAWSALESIPGFAASRDLQLLVASGMAAAALRIDMSEETLTVDLRAKLLQMLGGRKQYSTKSLVDALGYLLVARELMMQGRAN